MIVCPVCGTSPGVYRKYVYGYSIFKCHHCGLEYTDPLPSNAEVKVFYKNYSDIRADEKVLIANAVRNLQLMKTWGWNFDSLVLDFGCGKGVFGKVVGENCVSVDIGIEHYASFQYDFITMWGVLEHLAKPRETMKDLAGKLKQGGYIFLTTVNTESIIPYYYKPPEHLTYWTHNAMSTLATHAGLTVERYEPYIMKQKFSVYVDRLLSRTPESLKEEICNRFVNDILVEIPTNECLVIMRKE